ncbi:MAG: hypothetical protein ACO4CH_11815 [Saprospiraceae bacterium]
MAKCVFCGEPAGWFRDRHKECVEQFETSVNGIRYLTTHAITAHQPPDAALASNRKMESEGRLDPNDTEGAIVEGIDRALDYFLSDELLSKEEEASIDKYLAVLPVSVESLDKAGITQQIVKASVIRGVMNDEVVDPPRSVSANLPFLFQRSERLIWAFQGVDYHEMTTRREFRGGSQGISVRITKGVYYRTSAFKGQPVEIDELRHIANGPLALTTKHIYFGSERKSFKIPYTKLVALNTYSDAIRVQKDGVRSKPQIFRGLDGWFASNIISNAQ